MSYPAPLPGLVIGFSFLWSREAKIGATEGRKDRPCAIVVAVPRGKAGDLRVAVSRSPIARRTTPSRRLSCRKR